MGFTPQTQTFTNIDAAKWERIKAAVKAKIGITIADSTEKQSGSAKGITLEYLYTPATQTFVVTLVKESWYDPSADEIELNIAKEVEAA